MWSAFKAVLWSFFGVRKQSEYEADQQRLKVGHVIFAGVLCALVMVIGLYFLVKMIVPR